MKTFSELFNIILTANRDESRKASREVRKLLYSRKDDDVAKYDEIKKIIQNAPDEYVKIKELFRQENFVMAISVIYFLHDKESEPDFLFPWFFELIKHENGYIRYAVFRMFSNEFGPLTYHIRCKGEKASFFELSPETADHIIYKVFGGLNNMAQFLFKPQYKKYKYIDSLPTSPYKTVQQILAELRDDCGEEYIRRFYK